MDALAPSLKKIDGLIKKKLSCLSDKISQDELNELHVFLKEARELRQTIISLEEPEEEELFLEEVEDEESEAVGDIVSEEYEDDFVDFFVEGCRLIKNLYILLDDHKMKEAECHWIIEETHSYLDRARESVGVRVPELPPYRAVSKKRDVKSKDKKQKG